MSHARRSRLAVLVLLGSIALASCSSDETVTGSKLPSGQPGQGKPAVTMGTKNFTEQTILGQLYAQALRAKGFTVDPQAGHRANRGG